MPQAIDFVSNRGKIFYSQAEVNNNLVAPKLGEHTDGVLKKIGGYSDEDIAQFREAGVI